MIGWTCNTCGEVFNLFDYETGEELSEAMKEHIESHKVS